MWRREVITLVGGAVAWPFVVVRKATVCGAPAKRLLVG